MDTSPDTNLLLAYLASHDEPCPNCGYSLRGVREPKCPECGAAVRLATPKERSGIGVGRYALAVAALPMAIGVLFVVVGGLGLGFGYDAAKVAFGAFLMACGTGLLTLAFAWRHRSLSKSRQRLIDLLVWLLVVGAAFGLLYIILH